MPGLSCSRQDLPCSVWTLSYSMSALVPWPGIEPGSPALGVQSLSHWTTRESLWRSSLICSFPFPWVPCSMVIRDLYWGLALFQGPLWTIIVAASWAHHCYSGYAQVSCSNEGEKSEWDQFSHQKVRGAERRERAVSFTHSVVDWKRHGLWYKPTQSDPPLLPVSCVLGKSLTFLNLIFLINKGIMRL